MTPEEAAKCASKSRHAKKVQANYFEYLNRVSMKGCAGASFLSVHACGISVTETKAKKLEFGGSPHKLSWEAPGGLALHGSPMQRLRLPMGER